jgi:DNA-binding LacI/PurR family transcriptional regulator
VTIADIAERAGVTSGAVSIAVNGKRGVSEATRARILAVAKELNWRPSHAAQALMGKGAEAVGLVLARPAHVVGEEIFFSRFIAGVQAVLSERGYSLMLQMAAGVDAEMELHAKWIADGRVDGILVLDPRIEDPRVEALSRLDYPSVVVGGEADSGAIRSIHVDNAGGMALILEHLAALGHRRIGYVTGDQSFRHTQERIDVFTQFTEERGIQGAILSGDFDPDLARTATGRMLAEAPSPSAIVYDSEVMAIAGVGVLTAVGQKVPRDVSVVSFEDSSTCQVLHPTLTALSRDAVELGRAAAGEMLELLTGGNVEKAEQRITVIARESTAPPAA